MAANYLSSTLFLTSPAIPMPASASYFVVVGAPRWVANTAVLAGPLYPGRWGRARR